MSPVITVKSDNKPYTFIFGAVVEHVLVGIEDDTIKKRPAIGLFYKESIVPLMLKIIRAMQIQERTPEVYLERVADTYRVAVVFLLNPCSRELAINLLLNDREREESRNIVPDSGRLVHIAESGGLAHPGIENFLELFGEQQAYTLSLCRPFGAMVTLPWSIQLNTIHKRWFSHQDIK
jgi:hypothetical protein